MVHDIIKYLAIGKKGVFFYCELIEKAFVEKSKFWGRHEILFLGGRKGIFLWFLSFFLSTPKTSPKNAALKQKCSIIEK